MSPKRADYLMVVLSVSFFLVIRNTDVLMFDASSRLSQRQGQIARA